LEGVEDEGVGVGVDHHIMIVDNGSAFSWRDNGGRRIKSWFGMFCLSGWLAGCLAEVGVRSLIWFFI